MRDTINFIPYSTGKTRSKRTVSKWYNRSYTTILLLPIIFTIFFTLKNYHPRVQAETLISPLPTAAISPSPVQEQKVTLVSDDETRLSEHEQIVQFIKQTFGQDSDKAFKLLSCENSAIDPSAVNTYGNTPEGSRDIGIFMVNEHWQQTQGKFLFNWKINILIAKQLYDENGGSFKLWTCGRKLGI